jgi:hypothetical protein
MIARLLAIAAWLTAGHLVLFGLYWLLLATPESNVAMLAVSASSVLLMAALFGWIEAIGLLAWRAEFSPRELPRRGVSAAPGVWLATALFAAVWYLVAYADAMWSGSRGETDAWLMVHFGWTNTGALYASVGWLLALVRLVGLSMAVALASEVATGGFGGIRREPWVRAGLSPKRLLVLAAILAVCVWLPWRGVNWRPKWIAPNWQETVFVSVKLGAIYVLANIGCALVLATDRGRVGLPNAPSVDHSSAS